MLGLGHSLRSTMSGLDLINGNLEEVRGCPSKQRASGPEEVRRRGNIMIINFHGSELTILEIYLIQYVKS